MVSFTKSVIAAVALGATSCAAALAAPCVAPRAAFRDPRLPRSRRCGAFVAPVPSSQLSSSVVARSAVTPVMAARPLKKPLKKKVVKRPVKKVVRKPIKKKVVRKAPVRKAPARKVVKKAGSRAQMQRSGSGPAPLFLFSFFGEAFDLLKGLPK